MRCSGAANPDDLSNTYKHLLSPAGTFNIFNSGKGAPIAYISPYSPNPRKRPRDEEIDHGPHKHGYRGRSSLEESKVSKRSGASCLCMPFADFQRIRDVREFAPRQVSKLIFNIFRSFGCSKEEFLNFDYFFIAYENV